MFVVDLNSDLGESYGAYTVGNDKEVLKYISSANIACGYHAGDHNVMFETVRLSKNYRVQIGAHPGLPDIPGFGRREMNLSAREIYNLVIYQIGSLAAVCKVNGTVLAHVKPHGALYNLAAKNLEIAKAIAAAVYDFNPELVLFGLAGSELVKAGEKKGLVVAQEVFADRTYQPDGTLTPRTKENALIHDTQIAINRMIRIIKEGKVAAVDGADVKIKADTVCVHGDSPKALEFVTELKQALILENISIRKSWDKQ
ncbi:5-oxoprolinase subunit PxpA [Neobacillus sp. OS1-33]|uniref:LamB/YcsF family protein n=1 Tax=Neobacillus sp. OS1-33 TaxID=3070683 RepID=UPI0027E13E73|nr:5-oxoprolinase subunit PxpA [Neobacillus sp. OS1-33]WML25123.1 5-oxoprolinase subunit PxpA [Neobacillus sp. OS1-33]